MIKKLIGATLIAACLVWTAAIAASPNEGAENSYTGVASGRYYMMPRSAWLKEETIPMRYVQVFWYLEATGLSNAENITLKSPTKHIESWDTARKDALNKMISKRLLTKVYLSSSHPKEFYRPKDWNRMIQQHFLHRAGKTYLNYCKARLVIRAFKADGARSGNLDWWDEFVIPLASDKCLN